jgi:hemerythrin-like domain-containing protein
MEAHMAIQIGAKPDSGVDDPIGMLTDCHRRIEHFLHVLCHVAEQASGRALNDEESAAVRASLEYFRKGGQRHNADEEDSLFPRLRAAAQQNEFSEIAGLEGDHRDGNQLHEAVEKLYEKWLQGGALAPADQDKLLSLTRHLKHLYEAHIRLEEQVVFPRAAQLLDRQTIAQIGQEFRKRRE